MLESLKYICIVCSKFCSSCWIKLFGITLLVWNKNQFIKTIVFFLYSHFRKLDPKLVVDLTAFCQLAISRVHISTPISHTLKVSSRLGRVFVHIEKKNRMLFVVVSFNTRHVGISQKAHQSQMKEASNSNGDKLHWKPQNSNRDKLHLVTTFGLISWFLR